MLGIRLLKKRGIIFTKPQEDMSKIVKLFKKNCVKRVLDSGWGSGRHLVYLAKNGFEVYGIDVSKRGLKLARKWLKRKKVEC